MSGARELAERLAASMRDARGVEFFAPLLAGGRASVRVEGIVWTLRVARAAPGWWVCRATSSSDAALVGPGEPWQRAEYLALFPVLRVVLVEEIKPLTWVAVPYNPDEARTRLRIGAPPVVHLVEDAQPFDRITTRVDGYTCWYEGQDLRADPVAADTLRAAWAADQEAPEAKGLAHGERAAYALKREMAAPKRVETEEQRRERLLRHALTIGGATLVGFAVSGDQIRVTWERNGHRHTTAVGHDLGVVSSGICLSGRDRMFDLASVVNVVEQAPGFARGYGSSWEASEYDDDDDT